MRVRISYTVFKSYFEPDSFTGTSRAKSLLGDILKNSWSAIERTRTLEQAIAFSGIAYIINTENIQANFCAGSGSEHLFWAFYFWLHIEHPEHKQLQQVDEELLEGETFDQACGREITRGDKYTELQALSDRGTDGSKSNILNSPHPKAISGTSDQPPLFLPPRLLLDREKSNWLNPAVTDAIPFVGREEELLSLSNFATCEGNFQMWALSGPSGAGKTRLVTEWMRQFFESDGSGRANSIAWNIGFLDRDARSQWENRLGNWIPDRPTFIAIDYIYDAKKIIEKLVKQWRPPFDKSLNYPVRILLIDHIFPERLEQILDNPFLGNLSTGGADWDNKKEIFFKKSPLELSSVKHSESYLTKVMSSAGRIFGKKITDDETEIGIAELRRITAAWCPLFAALKGYAIAKESKSTFGDRRDLIRYYLNTTNRLPWLSEHDQERANGLLVGYFVSIATLLRGVSFENLIAALPRDALSARDAEVALKEVIARSCWLVSIQDSERLFAFEPDILGESLFLELYDFISVPTDRSKCFVEMLCKVSNLDSQYLKAEEFVGFFGRIARNLANDDQNDPKIVKYWENFLIFLNNDNYPVDTPIRFAVSIVLADIFEYLDALGHDELVNEWLHA